MHQDPTRARRGKAGVAPFTLLPVSGRPESGRPEPFGAHWDGDGTNFSVFSQVAERVELCLFDRQGAEQRVDLQERTEWQWHGYLPGIGPGQQYGFRVHGPWNPSDGQRCNPAKLLIDPYARAVHGEFTGDTAVLPYAIGSDGETRDDADSSPFVARSVVVDAAFDWEGDAPIRRPLEDTVIYEMHVKGFSKRNPAVPEMVRGTYAGLGHSASIEYLHKLGVTAVELLPIHAFVNESFLAERGLANYWGYNTIGFFAAHAAYASRRDDASEVVREFKQMVKALHRAGIEVILDVVYNHTAEGNHLGPMYSFKGLDNAAYYRLVPDSRRHYMDYTGVGNTLDLRHPQTLRLVMDSLRYWVEEMHVDGFRFDLATALARGDHLYDPQSPFLTAVAQDAVLRQVKLIAEPWDVGEGGYQVGEFPRRWAEWNGRYRDTVRDFWRSQPGTLPDLARRLTGSADLYARDDRSPLASVNFITAHDGFTLRDLVSYNDKHNEANLEDNRDGANDNRSWNMGAEGRTDDAEINARRSRQMRNFLATLLLSHGVPMLLAGDERGRTQQGNNNAFCQDNELSWLDWDDRDVGLEEFTRRLMALRREYRAFRRRRWAPPRPTRRPLAEIAWFAPGGDEMTEEEWSDPERRSIGLYLDDALHDPEAPSRDRFYLLLNAALEPVTVTLPSRRWGMTWQLLFDTADDQAGSQGIAYGARSTLVRPPLSLLLLRSARPGR